MTWFFEDFNLEPDCEMLIYEALENLYDVLDYLASTNGEGDTAYQWLLPVEEKLKKAMELFRVEEANKPVPITCKDRTCKYNLASKHNITPDFCCICTKESIELDKRHRCLFYCDKSTRVN